MKSQVAVLILFLMFLFLKTSAQNSTPVPPRSALPDKIGLFAGINTHRFYVLTTTGTNEAKLGYTFGINAEWIFKKFSVRSGLGVERKGFRTSYSVTYFDDLSNPLQGFVTNTGNLNYLILPVTFQVPIWTKGDRSIDIGAGGYAGYLYKSIFIDEPSWKAPTYSDTPYFKSLDFGFGTSVCYSFVLFRLRYQAEAYTRVGLSNINSEPGFSDAPVKNLSVGFMISVSKP